jgi:hypothetical protein
MAVEVEAVSRDLERVSGLLKPSKPDVGQSFVADTAVGGVQSEYR